MYILAIDTSTDILGVALAKDKIVLAQQNVNIGRRHFEKVFPAINRALKRARLSLKKIDLLAVALGPGSFTGMRIGVTIAKGLAFATGKPVVGVSTLDVIAKNILADDNDICVVMDAKRNLLYGAIYEADGALLKRKSPYLLIGIRDLLKRIKQRTIFVGDGLNLYQGLIQKRKKALAVFAPASNWLPAAGNLALLAGERFKKEKNSDPNKLLPLYLYPKECQIRNAKI